MSEAKKNSQENLEEEVLEQEVPQEEAVVEETVDSDVFPLPRMATFLNASPSITTAAA